MYKFSHQFSIEHLLEKSIEMIKGRFASVVRSEEFTDLGIDSLCELIEFNDIVLGKYNT